MRIHEAADAFHADLSTLAKGAIDSLDSPQDVSELAGAMVGSMLMHSVSAAMAHNVSKEQFFDMVTSAWEASRKEG